MTYRSGWDQLFAHRMVAGDCWLWTGGIRARGSNGAGKPYGGVRYQDEVWLVHRLAYTLANGPIPDGLQVDHICRTTLCFRPDHLRAVTNRENAANQDMAPIIAGLDRGRLKRWGTVRR